MDESDESDDLTSRFKELLAKHPNGIRQNDVARKLSCNDEDILPIVNELLTEHALTLWEESPGVMLFKLQDSTQLRGLDAEQMLVYQRIEDSGNKGIWTRELKQRTSLKQQRLTKILEVLERRKLVKPVKAVTAKNKKVYMLYDLIPSRDVTGGPWYSAHEFDVGFVEALREFLLRTIKAIEQKKRRGASVRELAQEIESSSVFSVEMSESDIAIVVNVLKFDGLIEEIGLRQGNSGSTEPTFKISKEMPDHDAHYRYLTDVLTQFGGSPAPTWCGWG